MASELKVDKFTGVTTAGSILVTGEGNSTTTSLQQGLLKAWADADMTGTATLDDSFNIASLTDNGTGDFTLAISNDMANGAYAISFGFQNQSSNQGSHIRLLSDGHKLAATVQCQKMENNSATDGDTNTVMIAGDLA
jgi:hypothetical protein